MGIYRFFKVLKIKCRSTSSQLFPDRCLQDVDHLIKCFWYVCSMSTKYSEKIHILSLDTRTYVCVSGGKK